MAEQNESGKPKNGLDNERDNKLDATTDGVTESATNDNADDNAGTIANINADTDSDSTADSTVNSDANNADEVSATAVSADDADDAVVATASAKQARDLTEAEKAKRKKRTIIASSLTAVAVAGAGIFLAVAGANAAKQREAERVEQERIANTIVVPMAAESQDRATAGELCFKFEDTGLNCEVAFSQVNTPERGKLISQSIAANSNAMKGDKITLTYSAGPSKSTFPNLSNRSLDDAEAILYKLGVNISDVKEVNDSGLSSNRVVSASVKEGSVVNNGDSITLNVSTGKVKVPDWAGKSRDFVEADANRLGIDVKFTESESGKTPNTVVSQSPKAGSSAPSDKVRVTLSKEAKEKSIEIPDVINKTPNDALTELAVAGFREINKVEVATSDVKSEKVTQVSPKVGSKAKSGDPITVIVSVPKK